MNRDSKFTQEDKIYILLAEYTVLHTKLFQINTVMFQTYGVGLAAITAIVAITYQASALAGIALLIILPLCLFVAFRFTHVETLLTAQRVREIEAELNAIAGEPLLIWQTKSGIASQGYLPRIRRVVGLPPN